jgi:NAD(P)-dependent dehydrogenase (short-subunit alcohol dehydrogenase family)
MGKLEKKRAVVTGSSSGIGAGVALAFAKEGADVIINFPGPKQKDAAEKIAEMVRGQGRRSKAIQADVSEPEEVSRLVEAPWKRLAVSTSLSTMRGSLAPTMSKTCRSRNGTA